MCVAILYVCVVVMCGGGGQTYSLTINEALGYTNV